MAYNKITALEFERTLKITRFHRSHVINSDH